MIKCKNDDISFNFDTINQVDNSEINFNENISFKQNTEGNSNVSVFQFNND
jgi:hypothetical protein